VRGARILHHGSLRHAIQPRAPLRVATSAAHAGSVVAPAGPVKDRNCPAPAPRAESPCSATNCSRLDAAASGPPWSAAGPAPSKAHGGPGASVGAGGHEQVGELLLP